MTRLNKVCYILCIFSIVSGTAVVNLLIWGKGFFLRESIAWKSLGLLVVLFFASLATLLVNLIYSQNTPNLVKEVNRDLRYFEDPPRNAT
jgi:hypothetical protein